jgi:hypothetical protein
VANGVLKKAAETEQITSTEMPKLRALKISAELWLSLISEEPILRVSAICKELSKTHANEPKRIQEEVTFHSNFQPDNATF